MDNLFTAIYYALAGTPAWVYILFFYLMFIGFQASKPSVVPLWKMATMPVIFIWLSFHSLIYVIPYNVTTIGSLIFGLLIGGMIGWLLVYRHPISVDKEKKLLKLPGSWLTLNLILLIFTVKYYFGYELAVDPQRLYHFQFEVFMLIVSALCTGLFIGRFGLYLYRFKTGPFETLTET